MRSRSIGFLAVLLALGCAWIAGVLLFPRALEPGHAERNGIRINSMVNQGGPAGPNDWFTATSGVAVSHVGDVLRIEAGGSTGTQLVTRPLPTYPGNRYTVTAEVAARGEPAELQVTDATDRHLVAQARIPVGTKLVRISIPVAPGHPSKLSIAVVSRLRSVVRLRSAVLTRGR